MIETLINVDPFSWLLLILIWVAIVVLGANICILAFNSIDGWEKFKRLRTWKQQSKSFSIPRIKVEPDKYYFWAFWDANQCPHGSLVHTQVRGEDLVFNVLDLNGKILEEGTVISTGGEFYGPVTAPWDKE